MRTALTFLFFIALALTTLWWSFGSHPSRSSLMAGQPTSAAETQDDRDAHLQDPSSLPRAPVHGDPAPHSESSSSGTGNEDNKSRIQSSDPTGLQVQVILASTQEPVPNAHVYLIPREVSRDWDTRMAMLRLGTVGLAFQEFGAHYQADADGQVGVRFASTEGSLLARWNNGTSTFQGGATIELDSHNSLVTIAIRPIETFRVKVLDRQMQPVGGATVELRLSVNEPNNVAYELGAILEAQTAHDTGVAILENSPFQFDSVGIPVAGPHTSTMIGVKGLFPHPIQVPVDWKSTEPEEITLSIPAFAAVQIQPTFSNGRAIQSGRLYLTHPDKTQLGPSKSLHAILKPGHPNPTFEFVALNQTLETRLSFSDFAPIAKKTFKGPTKAGVTTIVPWQLDREGVLFRGKLIDSEKRPFADAEIHLGVIVDKGMGFAREEALHVWTDSEGGFSFEGTWLNEGENNTPLLTLRSERNREGPLMEFRTRVLLPSPLPNGEHDLGTITIRQPPVVAAGQILAPDGRGFACKLDVMIKELKDTTRVENATVTFGKPGTYEMEIAGKEDFWRVQTDLDGNFVVWGFATRGFVSFDLPGSEHQLKAIDPVAPGTTGLVLNLVRESSVTVRFAGLPKEGLKFLRLRLSGEGRQIRRSHPAELEPIQFGELGQGTYELVLQAKDLVIGDLWKHTIYLKEEQTLDLGTIALPHDWYAYEVELERPSSENTALDMTLVCFSKNQPQQASVKKKDHSRWDIGSFYPIDEVMIQLDQDTASQSRHAIRPGHNLLMLR